MEGISPLHLFQGIGTLVNNSVNSRAEYAPPRSQGLGPKT